MQPDKKLTEIDEQADPIEGKPSTNTREATMFLLSDTQIINETFLEDINNILNAGEACMFPLPHFSPLDFLEC